jgi:hypothetical protein
MGFLDGFYCTASFNRPYDIAIDSYDNIFIADKDNSAIRRLSVVGWSKCSSGQVFSSTGYCFDCPVGK